MTHALKRESIIPRLDGIARDVEKLTGYAQRGLSAVKANDEIFSLCQFYLHRALEGVFHIGEHILSRLNGGRATEYKEIARLLGEKGIVDKKFADTQLKAMAGYRNRLTHFYADITPEEIFSLLSKNLDDFHTFLAAIKRLLKNPSQFGLTLE